MATTLVYNDSNDDLKTVIFSPGEVIYETGVTSISTITTLIFPAYTNGDLVTSLTVVEIPASSTLNSLASTTAFTTPTSFSATTATTTTCPPCSSITPGDIAGAAI